MKKIAKCFCVIIKCFCGFSLACAFVIGIVAFVLALPLFAIVSCLDNLPCHKCPCKIDCLFRV